MAEAFNAVALRLNSLHDLSQLLATASQLDQVLDGILSAVGHIVGPGAAAIYLIDDSGDTLVPARTRGIDLADARPVDMSTGAWLSTALESPGPTDLEADSETLADAIPGLTGVHAGVLAAPLVAGSQPLGVVIVLRDGTRPVSDAEREMVRTFSAQAAVAVNTSRLFREESESRQIAEALRAVAEELVRPESLEEALRNVETIARGVLGAVVVRIVASNRAVQACRPNQISLTTASCSVWLYAPSLGSGLAISVVLGDDRAVDVALRENDAVELLAVPIGLDSEHGAVMVVALPEGNRGQEALLVAQHSAMEYFHRVGQRVLLRASGHASREPGDHLPDQPGCGFLASTQGGTQPRARRGSEDSLGGCGRASPVRRAQAILDHRDGARAVLPDVLHLELEPGSDVPGRVFSSGEPVAIRDLHTGMDGLAGAAAHSDLGSLLAVPMLARGRSIGVLMVFSGQRGAFPDEDINVLRTFASQAALSLDTARLYSREHQVATVLQQSILPEALPDFPELTAASVYAPAGEDAENGRRLLRSVPGPGRVYLVRHRRRGRKGCRGSNQDVDDQVRGTGVRCSGSWPGQGAGRGEPDDDRGWRPE